MSEFLEETIMEGDDDMQKSLEHLAAELTKIRAGKASPAMLSSVNCDYYGTPTPISQVANMGTADSKTITIQPWEKGMLAVIERAIFEANLGLTPMNDGEFIRISVPPMTHERRKDLVKQCKGIGEDAKVSLRSIRHKLMDAIKKEVKEGYPEDAGKRKEEEVEDKVKSYTKKIENMIDAKEKDIMTV